MKDKLLPRARDRALVIRALRRWLLRAPWLIAVVLATVIMVCAVACAIVPTIYLTPLIAAIIATMPAMTRTALPTDAARPDWSAGALWIAAFVVVLLAIDVPPVAASYFALRRSEICLHAASVWLQGEHGGTEKRTVRCGVTRSRE